MSQPQKKNKWIPPDPVAIQMNIRKKMIERKGSKYLQIRVFKKYRIGTSIEVQDGGWAANQTFQHSDDHNMWMIIKAYFPVDSEIKRFKQAMMRKDGVYDRVGAKIPEKFWVEVETPRLWPPKVRDQLHAHVHKNLREFMKSIKLDGKGKKADAFYLLTDKNWDIVDDLPKQDKRQEVKLKDLNEGFPF